MEIFKEEGLRGRTYYVFDRKTKVETAIEEASRYRKCAKSNMVTMVVYLDNDLLYLSPGKGRTKALAVIRKPKE